MSKKLNVAVLCGGASVEHEVSLQSARNVVEALDRDKYSVVLIGIDKSGRWHKYDDEHDFLLNADDPNKIALKPQSDPLSLLTDQSTKSLIKTGSADEPEQIDIVFPVLHGANGEDGTMQGLLELSGIPYVGSGVLGSAVSMDKDITKRLLREAGLPVVDFITLRRHERDTFDRSVVAETVGYPCFVKSVGGGSSLGVSRVESPSALDAALDDAFSYDKKLIIESAISGREIECAILGNDDPKASLPGEILVPQGEYYSYNAKYLDGDRIGLKTPADLTAQQIATIQSMALATFQTLECRGLARVDFFLADDGKLYINEVNPLPGFTNISMYSKMWAATGIPYETLVDELINLGLEAAS